MYGRAPMGCGRKSPSQSRASATARKWEAQAYGWNARTVGTSDEREDDAAATLGAAPVSMDRGPTARQTDPAELIRGFGSPAFIGHWRGSFRRRPVVVRAEFGVVRRVAGADATAGRPSERQIAWISAS